MVYDRLGNEFEFAGDAPGEMTFLEDTTSLAFGGYMVTWSTSGSRMMTQRFNSDGSPVTAPLELEMPEVGWIQIVGMENGGHAVLYHDEAAPNPAYKVRFFDAAGRIIGTDRTVAVTDEGAGGLDMRLTTLDRDGIGVYWQDVDFETGALTYQEFTGSGEPVAGPVVISATTRTDAPMSVLPLDGGTLLAFFTEVDAEHPEGRAVVQRWSYGGFAGGPLNAPQDWPGSPIWGPSKVLKLSNGSYLALMSDLTGTQGLFLSSSGVPTLSARFTYNADNGYAFADAIAHDDGTFSIVWQQSLGGNNDVMIERYAPVGATPGAGVTEVTVVSTQQTVHASASGQQYKPMLAELDNGQFVVVWNDVDVGWGSTVHGQVLDSGIVVSEDYNSPPEWSGTNDLDGFLTALDRPGQAIEIPLWAYFADPDGDLLFYDFSGLPAGLAVDRRAGTVSGTFNGPATVNLTVHDNNGGARILTFAIGGAEPVPQPDGSDPVDPPPGPTPQPNTGLLAIELPGAWTVAPGPSQVFTFEGEGSVYIGHALGTGRLLRVTGADIRTDGRTVRFEDAVVHDATGNTSKPLFTGDFTIDIATLRSTALSEDAPAYAPSAEFAFGDLAAARFTSLRIEPGRAVLGFDAVFQSILPIGATATGGSLTLSPSGMEIGRIGDLGSGQWNYSLDPRRFGIDWKLDFEDLGFAWDVAQGQGYLFGRGEARFRFLGAERTVILDIAGDQEHTTGVFEPGDKFIRYTPGRGLDLVGTLTYEVDDVKLRATDFLSRWGFRSVEIDVDTITGRYRIGGEAKLPFFKDVSLTAEFQAYWPRDIDSGSIGFKVNDEHGGLKVGPVWLTGASIGFSGLADIADDDPNREVSVSFDFSLGKRSRIHIAEGTLTGGLVFDPTDDNGGIDGARLAMEVETTGDMLVSKAVESAIRAGTDTGNSKVNSLKKYLGVDPADFLDFKLFEASGNITWHGSWGEMSGQVDFRLFEGVVVGRAKFINDVDSGFGFYARVSATFPETLGLVGGKTLGSVNVFVEASYDDNLSNDAISVWVDFNVFDFESAAGFRVSWGEGLEFIGLSELPRVPLTLTGQIPRSDAATQRPMWRMEGDEDWVLLSAQWANPGRGARLVLITPDGERLTERDIARRADLEIVEELTSGTQRSVAVLAPDAGGWRLAVEGLTRPGAITYSASIGVAAPQVEVTGVRADADRRKVIIDLDASGNLRGAEVDFYLDTNRTGRDGLRLDADSIDLRQGTQTIKMDYSGVGPGRYFLYAVYEGEQVPVRFAYGAGAIDLNFVKGGGGADLLQGTRWAELIRAGGGHDTIAAGLGDDTVEGGAGRDVISYAGLGRKVTIDLAEGQATGRGIAAGLSGIEGAEGGRRADVILGDRRSNALSGHEGADRIVGGAGRDRIDGGAGADRLTGGRGADVFVFDAAGDSGTGRRADRITDFAHGRDRIDLSDLVETGHFIGRAAFSGEAGEVRYLRTSGRVLVDLDGDARADMEVVLANEARLSQADFIFGA